MISITFKAVYENEQVLKKQSKRSNGDKNTSFSIAYEQEDAELLTANYMESFSTRSDSQTSG